MPFSFENVSKEVAAGAEDVKKNLEGLIGVAEDVDKAFAKMTERQEAAIAVFKKFDVAMATSKRLEGKFKAISTKGVPINVAVGGLKSLDDLERRIRDISTTSIPVNVVVGSLKSLDDLEQRLNAMNNITVNVGTMTRGGGVGKGGVGDGFASAIGKTKIRPSASALKVPVLAAIEGDLTLTKKVGGKAGQQMGKSLGEAYVAKIVQVMRSATSKNRDTLELLKAGPNLASNKKRILEVSIQISNEDVIRRHLDDLSKEEAEAFKKDAKKMSGGGEVTEAGEAKAIENLIKSSQILALHMKKGAKDAEEAVDELTSHLRQLEAQVDSDAKSFGDLFKKSFAQGGIEMSKFADGLGGNATGMMAVGVAGAFLATKLGDLAASFADAAVSLAKYKTETAAAESTIIGMSKGGLDQMRKSLSLTREQASSFFDVVTKGVNELGMSKEEIMAVSKALQETFGGDQTERLRKYVDLLETIPTIKTDLSITASMDDKAAAIFGLAKTGKIDVAMDLQTAGLLGGVQNKQPGADTANAAARTAAGVEKTKDWLIGTMYPDWGFKLSAIVDATSKVATAVFSAIGVFGALRFMMLKTSEDNLASRAVATGEIVTGFKTGAVTGGGGFVSKAGAGSAKGLSRLTKGLGIAAIATFGLEMGFDALGKHLKETGDETGAAGAQMGKAASAVAGMALTGAALGSVFPVVGTAAGAVAGALLGLYNESENIGKAFDGLGKSADSAKDKTLALADAKYREISQELKSGQILQRFMVGLSNELNSSNFTLVDFRKALASIQMDNLSKLGGGSQEYAKAMKSASDANSAKFGKQMSIITSSLLTTLSKPGLTKDAAQEATMVAEKAAGEATREFVDAMNQAIEAISKSPELIKRGLESRIREIRLSAGREGSQMSLAEKFTKEKANMAAAMTDYYNAVEIGQAEFAKASQLQKDLDAKNVKAKELAAQKILAIQLGQITKEEQAENERVAVLDAASKESLAASEKAAKAAAYYAGTGGTSEDDSKILADRERIKYENLQKSRSEVVESQKVSKSRIDERAIVDPIMKRVINKDTKQMDEGEVEKSMAELTKMDEKLAGEMETATKVWKKSLADARKEMDPEKRRRLDEKAVTARTELNKVEARRGVITGAQETLKVGIGGATGENTALEVKAAAMEKTKEANDRILKIQEDAIESSYKQLDDKRKEAAIADVNAALASELGSGTKERMEAEKKNADLYAEEYKNAQRNVVSIKKAISNRQQDLKESKAELADKTAAYQAVPESDMSGKAAAKGAMEIAENDVAVIAGSISVMKDRAMKSSKDSADAAAKLSDSGNSVSDAIAKFNASLAGRKIEKFKDLSDALFSAAENSGDLAKVSREAFQIALKASKDKLKEDKKAIDAGYEAGKKKIDEAANMMGGADGERYRISQMETLEADKRLSIEKLQTAVLNDGLDAARKVRDFKEKELDIQQSLLDDAMSFASDFGGSFSSIMKMQDMNVGFARQQLDLAKQYRDDVQTAFDNGDKSAKNTAALLEANVDVAKRTMGLRRQELGIQKSLMDRLLGAAFGGLNSSIGARRQVGSNQALMGVAATRMKTAGGMYVNVPGGAPGTIAKRSLQRQMAGAGGAFNPAGVAGEGGGGDIVSTVMAALNSKPETSKLDRALDVATATTAQNTGRTNEILEAMAKEYGIVLKSSIVTAKNTTKMDKTEKTKLANSVIQSKLDMRGGNAGLGRGVGPLTTFAALMQSRTDEAYASKGSVSQFRGLGGTGDIRSLAGTKGDIRTMGGGATGVIGLGGSFKTAADLAGRGGITAAPLNSGISAREVGSAGATGMAAMAAGMSVPPMSGTRAAAGRGAGGAASTEGTPIKLTGEMLVHWDSGPFKDQMAKVLASLIPNPDVSRAIQQATFKS